MAEVNLYMVLVRRDAHTITPTTVPEYEIPILQKIAGEENVTNVDGKRVDSAGPGSPLCAFDAADEYNRLQAKYGPDLVAAVFGPDPAAVDEKVKKATVCVSPARKTARAPHAAEK